MKLLLKVNLVLAFLCTNALGGVPVPRKSNTDNIKFFFGIRAGINFTSVDVLNRYTIFASTSITDNTDFKTYNSWIKNIGSQYGLIGMFQFNELSSVVVQPSFITHNFNYTNRFIWNDILNPADNITLVYRNKQSLKYAEFPVVFRRDLFKRPIRPYLQLGGYYSFLQSAGQTSNLTEQFTIGQVISEIPEGNPSSSTTNSFIHTNLGVVGGGGVAYSLEYATICFDILYKKGLHNITNEQNRYSNQTLIGNAFDVPDDIKINALVVSLNIIFSIGNNRKKRSVPCPVFN